MNYTFSDRMNGLKPSAIREILKATSDKSVIPFAAGNPAPEAFPTDIINEITKNIFESTPIEALQYGVSEGYTPLRNTLKADLKNRFDIDTDNNEIIITAGAQQAVEVITKVLINPSDVVLVERPSFIGSLNTFRSYQAELVGVDVKQDGIDISDLENAIKENKNIKMIYVIPNFQNPSGASMSLEKRKALYDICVKNHIFILEDNPYGELAFDREYIPSIKSFDKDGIVIYCGSFSKVLSPGLRVGYLCAPKDIVAKCVVCIQASTVHTPMLNQMICNEFMTKYDYTEHIKRLCEIYKKKCGLMLELFDKYVNPKITYIKPQGGLFMWCTLPDNVDMLDFCKKTVENKLALVPGVAFLPTAEETTQSFRINYSTPTDEQIIKGVEILGRLSQDL